MPTEKTIKLLQYIQEHPEEAGRVNWDKVKTDSPDLKMDVVYKRFNVEQPVATPTAQPTIPDTFAATPQPSSTAVMPITQKKVGTLEPEDPVSTWAVLRNLGRSVGRLVDPKTLSEGSRELLDQIGQSDPFTKKGRQKLNEIVTQFGEPLRDWTKVTNYIQSGRFLVEKPTPGIQQAFRNIGIDPLAGPATAGMVYGGASGLSRLAGRAGTALGRSRLAPMAEGEVAVATKPKAQVKPVTPKPKAKAKVERIREDLPEAKPIIDEMDKIGARADKRRTKSDDSHMRGLRPATIDWMTDIERARFHELQLKLRPKTAGEAKADVARKRAERLAKPTPKAKAVAPTETIPLELKPLGEKAVFGSPKTLAAKATPEFWEWYDRIGGKAGAAKLGYKVRKGSVQGEWWVYKSKPAPRPAVVKKTSVKAQQETVNAKFKAIDEQIVAIEEQKLKPTVRLNPAKVKELDKKILALGEQKLAGQAGRVYVPIDEVRAATSRAVKALDLKTAPETKAVRDLNAVRRGDIAEADVRVGFAKKEIHRVVTDPKRREAITHAIENPKLASGLSEIEKGVLNEIKRFYDEGFKVANDADVISSAVENYINHVWEVESPKRTIFSGKYISGKTPFAKQRKIPSIAEGEKMGMVAKTKDPGELMEIWSRSVHRAIANKRFLDNLKIAQAEDGRLLIQPAQSAPADYVSYDHPSLRQYRWRGKKGKGAVFQTGVKIHPQIAGAMDVAFGQGWQPRGVMAQRVFNAYTALDQAAKKSILTISLFHYHALSESAIATGQSPWAFVRGVAKLAGNEELIVRAKRSGLQIAGTPDAARQSLRFEKVPTFVGKGLRATVGKIVEKNDKFLWDDVHAGGKIEAFDRITRETLTNKKYSHLKPTEIDRVVSTFVNDAFGGLDWEALGTSTKGQWVYQRSLLAPDWTRAQIRVFKGMFKLGKKGTSERLSGELYRAYWRRAITYNLGGANALNYVFTAWKAGDPRKGHFMPQNASGHKFQLEMPYEGDDGKPRWIQVGKQFMEPFRYVEDVLEGKPLRTLSGKVNPIPRMIVSSVFNRKYPGGPSIYKEDDSPGMKYLKQMGYVGKSVTPIPAQQYIGVAEGWKDPMDAFISGLGFPVKRDYGQSRRGRSRGTNR